MTQVGVRLDNAADASGVGPGRTTSTFRMKTGYGLAECAQVNESLAAIQPSVSQRNVDAPINVGKNMKVKE